jgi:hypothetical protein
MHSKGSTIQEFPQNSDLELTKPIIMNWFFLGGAVGPVIIWLFHKSFPKQSWIPLINLPVLLGSTVMMPLATPLTYNAWIMVGTIFNFSIFRYRSSGGRGTIMFF